MRIMPLLVFLSLVIAGCDTSGPAPQGDKPAADAPTEKIQENPAPAPQKPAAQPQSEEKPAAKPPAQESQEGPSLTPPAAKPAPKSTEKSAAKPAPKSGEKSAAAGFVNPVLKQLIDVGIAMPDGTMVRLLPPVLSDGLTAAAQQEAIKKILPRDCPLEKFLSDDPQAPLSLKIGTVKGKGGATSRRISLRFAARGKWSVLTSQKFADTIIKQKKKDKKGGAADKAAGGGQGGAMNKAGFLTKEELAKRGLKIKEDSQSGDRYFYSTFALFEMVEVSATRYAVLNKSPDGIVLAGRLDPRFANDPDYPNQWRAIIQNAQGKPVFGPRQPYSGTGFYLKVTRLHEPKNAIFIDFHLAFDEPCGWFDGKNVLRTELPTPVSFQVHQFRTKLAEASEQAAEK